MARIEDNDGLESHYDLIIAGTGLIESIISCAAGKAGLNVLHLDKNDFYGDKYNSNSLDSFLKCFSVVGEKDDEKNIQKMRNEENNRILMNNSVDDVFIANFQSDKYTKLVTINKKMQMNPSAVHPSCIGYQMDMENSSPNSAWNFSDSSQINPIFREFLTKKELNLSRALLRSRDFNIDTTSRVFLSSGLFIETLINSGVHKYLEFKAIEGLYFYIPTENNAKVSPKLTPESNELWKVPCSTADIFNTKQISLLEKRVLNKFNSFIMDYGKIHFSNTDVYALNEIELASGRSLYRPQNKQNVTVVGGTDGSQSDSSGYNIQKFIDLPFEDFLTDCKLSPKLQYIIMYALCFRTTPANGASKVSAGDAAVSGKKHYTTREGVFDLYAHMNSLGRFGSDYSALLSTIYGTAEITQAYCRMSAVWGATFILRRGVQSVTIGTTPMNAGDVVGEDVVAKIGTSEDGKNNILTSVTDSTGKTFSCTAFVCGINYWPLDTHNKVVFSSDNSDEKSTSVGVVECTALTITRISVCSGYLLPLSRGIAIIPPNASYLTNNDSSGAINNNNSTAAVRVELNNTHAVHVIQSADNSLSTATSGTSILHITTTIDLPSRGQGEVSWRDAAKEHQAQAVDLMDRVVELLKATYCVVGTKESEVSVLNSFVDHKFKELTHTTTITPLFTTNTITANCGSDDTSANNKGFIPSNVGLCYDSTESFHMSNAVHNAKSIFSRLFPKKPFLVSEEDAEEEKLLQEGNAAKEEENGAKSGSDEDSKILGVAAAECEVTTSGDIPVAEDTNNNVSDNREAENAEVDASKHMSYKNTGEMTEEELENEAFEKMLAALTTK